MRFGYAITYVPDVEATIAFWEQAFGLERPDGGRRRRVR